MKSLSAIRTNPPQGFQSNHFFAMQRNKFRFIPTRSLIFIFGLFLNKISDNAFFHCISTKYSPIFSSYLLKKFTEDIKTSIFFNKYTSY